MLSVAPLEMTLHPCHAVYKPGATIHVRSVCLLPSLKPCTDQKAIRLVLMNPEGTKVQSPAAESPLYSLSSYPIFLLLPY